MRNANIKEDPSFTVSLLVFLSIVGILVSGIFLLKVDIHVLLIPWTTAGAFMASTLGVPVVEYSRYAFLNIINPLLSIVLSFMGIFILRYKKISEKVS